VVGGAVDPTGLFAIPAEPSSLPRANQEGKSLVTLGVAVLPTSLGTGLLVDAWSGATSGRTPASSGARFHPAPAAVPATMGFDAGLAGPAHMDESGASEARSRSLTTSISSQRRPLGPSHGGSSAASKGYAPMLPRTRSGICAQMADGRHPGRSPDSSQPGDAA